MNAYFWLLFWLSFVAGGLFFGSVVSLGVYLNRLIAEQEASRAGACGRGCRPEAGGHGRKHAQPGGDGSPLGQVRPFRVVRPGWIDVETRSE